MKYLFPVIVMANFAAGLTARTLDPVLPLISQDLLVTAQVAATLASAAAFSFAFIQLPLGAISDFFGKPRLILTGLALLTAGNFVGAFAASFEVLLVTRIVSGIAAGSVFPVTMALAADLFTVEERRVAMSRLMAGGQIGMLLGSAIAGVLGDLIGWRGVLTTLGTAVLIATAAIAWAFRHEMRRAGKRVDFAHVTANYRQILAHRHARLCYFGAFAEGVLVFGVVPFIAAFFVAMGEPRASIAGIVIGGHAVGGLVYALTVKRLMALLGEIGVMKLGAIFMGTMIMLIGFGPPWPVQFVAFAVMGYGFYSLHGGFLIFNSEVVPQARSSALSLSAFCFNVGQFAGPLIYGFALVHIDKLPTLLIAGSLMVVLGLAVTFALARKMPEP